MVDNKDCSVVSRGEGDGKFLNPFARVERKKNEGDGTVDGQTTIRRILAPCQPPVVYADNSKSAAILSTMLTSHVRKAENVARVVERKRASVVPLLGLRDKVARLVGSQERVSKAVGDSSGFKKGGNVADCVPCPTKDVKKECQEEDEVVVVEEINLVSSDDDDDGDKHVGGKSIHVGEKMKVEDASGQVRSTGVALFDAFCAGTDDVNEEGEEEELYEEDDEEHISGIATRDNVSTELHVDNVHINLPRMVEVDGMMQPWWKRFPDFVPVAELVDGKDPRNGQIVFVNYVAQFKGSKTSEIGTSKRRDSKRKTETGHWISKDGERCFVTSHGESLSGRAAYLAYKKSKSSAGKKTSTRKRRKKRTKKKS